LGKEGSGLETAEMNDRNEKDSRKEGQRRINTHYFARTDWLKSGLVDGQTDVCVCV